MFTNVNTFNTQSRACVPWICQNHSLHPACESYFFLFP